MLSSLFFSLDIKLTVCGGGMTMRWEERGRRKRWAEEREMINFLVIYEFAEEFVEPAGEHF
jgi:hypothetical protein